MTRYPFSELRGNKFEMEDDKERHVKRSEAIEISCGDGKKESRGESLQEAFKKFRKDRQVFIKQTDMNYLMRKYLGFYSDRSTAGRRLCRNFIYPASRGPSIFLGKSFPTYLGRSKGLCSQRKFRITGSFLSGFFLRQGIIACLRTCLE